MAKARTVVRSVIALALLVLLSPALYYYGTTWIRGPVSVEVEDVFPVGNKGTLEAKFSFPNGEVHRVLNRDQELLFWKIDSEGVDNELSTARKERRRAVVWISGLYMPLFGDSTLFNHMNVLAVDPRLPPGVVPAVSYALGVGALLLWLRGLFRRLGAGARSLAGRGESRESV